MKRFPRSSAFLVVAAALAAGAYAARADTAQASATATVTGHITSAGKPLAGAVVVAAYHDGAFAARTDANGAYSIAGVPTGHHDVFSFASGSYIYDHGGYPDLKAGDNDHSRTLVHVPDTHRAPTVSHVTYATTSAAPGGTIEVSGDWQAHDGTAVSDEIFVYVPEFGHVDRFGVGKTKVGANPGGTYTAHLAIPADAKPGTYTAYVFGASEACYTNVVWPTQTITVR